MVCITAVAVVAISGVLVVAIWIVLVASLHGQINNKKVGIIRWHYATAEENEGETYHNTFNQIFNGTLSIFHLLFCT